MYNKLATAIMSPDRILVVEDEPMVAEVVERYLRRDGYEVRLYKYWNAATVLRAAHARVFNLATQA